MSNSTIEEALASAARITSRLGIDCADEIQEIAGFLKGPHVVAVAGLPGSGRSTVGQRLQPLPPATRMLELDLRTAGKRGLWDALILVTPADRALSQNEEEVARTSRLGRRATWLVVSRADGLGTGEARRAAEEEIATLRLEPALGRLGVPWHFNGTDDSLEALAGQLAFSLAKDPRQAHERAALDGLSRLLERAIAEFSERVRRREREYEQLRELQASVPLTLAYLEEVVRLARLTAAEEGRAVTEGLLEAGHKTLLEALAWLEGQGAGDWADVERPLREAWDAALVKAPEACASARDGVLGELGRLAARIDLVAEQLGLSPRMQVPTEGRWSSEDVERAAGALPREFLEPRLEDLRSMASDEVRRKCDEEAPEEPDPDEGDWPKSDLEELGDQLRDTAKALVAKARNSMQGPFAQRAEARLLDGLSAMLRPKLSRLTEAATITSEVMARNAVNRFAEQLTSTVDLLQRELRQRHQWGEAYQELLDLASWVDLRREACGH